MSLSYNSLDNSKAIALRAYYKNKSRQKIVYLNDKKETLEYEKITSDMLADIFGKTSSRYPKHHDKLKNELLSNTEEMPYSEIRIDDNSHFDVLPPTMDEERQIYYVSGQSGAGKSYFARKLLDLYKKLGYKNIFVITTVKDDEYEKYGSFLDINNLVDSDSLDYEDALEKYKEMKIKLKHKKKLFNNIDDRIALECEVEKLKPKKGNHVQNFKTTDGYNKLITKPSVFVFDDVESLGKAEYDKVLWLMNKQATTGRHNHINMVIISHLTTFGMQSRTLLNESHMYILFSRTLPRAIDYLLENYLDLSKQHRRKIKDMLKSSRFVAVNRLDKYVVSEKKIFTY